MQKDFTEIGGVSLVFTDTKEQLIECEMVLPDYYPEISKVLKCSVCTGIEDITQSGDKVSVAGKAEIKLIYTDNEKHINIFSSLAKYTKVFSGGDIDPDDTCFVTQTVGGIEHRAVAPRKCEVRASSAIKLMCIRKLKKQVLSEISAPCTEVRFCSLDLFDISTVKQFELNFSETVDLPATDSKITGVLYSSQEISFSDEKVIKNKVMLKGNCEITARFVTEQGSLAPEAVFNLPFTEITPLSGAEDEDICKLLAESVCARIAVDEQGKSAQIFISASVKCVCGKQNSLSLPDDVYSVREDTQVQQDSLSVVSDFVPVDKYFTLSSDAECYDDTATAVTAFFTDTPLCSMIFYDGQARLNGTVGVNFIVGNSEGNVSVISRSCNFDEPLGMTESGTGFADCVAKITAASLRNGRIDYTLKIEAKGYCVKCKKQSFITDVTFEKSDDKDKCSEKIVLYYAHEGESLWSIAKENGCSAGKIKELNGLTEEKTEKSQMLILVK